jgi:hypothetical protein
LRLYDLKTSSNNELRFVLHVLNPLGRRIETEELSGLNEAILIEILEKNKVFPEFIKKLNDQPTLKEELISKYPRLNQILNEKEVSQASDLREFLRISGKLSGHGIPLLLIKSTGDFPYESSNIDCLVEPDKLVSTVRTLLDEGYRECSTVREPHKFLFRKRQAPKELPLHIHTRVEWEAIEFADPKTLRARARPFLNGRTGSLIPSVEDALLINIAHYFFEDHEIKIRDLLALWSLAVKDQIRWDYVFGEVERLGWNSALFLNMHLINTMSEKYFGQKVFFGLTEKSLFDSASIIQKTVYFRTDGVLRIPYGISALFFLEKVVKNSAYTIPEKSRQIIYVCSDAMRRKINGIDL